MLCGVTATLGSNPSATATAARPRWGRAALSCPSGVCPERALCARVVCVRGRLCRARRLFCLKYRSGSPAMSHVIPPRLLQTLNRGRWNCNVCGLSRKMTELNYVRNLAGGFLDDACRRRSQALRSVGRAPIGGFFRLKYRSGSPTMSHVIPLWLVQTLNLYRWNCNVFGLSRKMTGLNYVRNLAGGLLDDACRRRSQALRSVGRCVRLVVARWKMHFA